MNDEKHANASDLVDCINEVRRKLKNAIATAINDATKELPSGVAITNIRIDMIDVSTLDGNKYFALGDIDIRVDI